MGAADVKAALERLGLRPNAALGQNFLCDDAAIARIAAAACISGLPMVEVGPGLGALTGALVKNVPALTAVELDKSMVAALHKRFSGENHLTVINSDILKFPIDEKFPEKFAVAGNLPYYITTPIVLMMLRRASRIPVMTFMVQKEAARRFFAQPGTKLYGPLGIMAQHYYNVESILELSPQSYYPQPNVDSEVVRLSLKSDINEKAEPNAFCDFLEAAFSMRRKTLYNNLKPLCPNQEAAKSALIVSAVDERTRSEALTPEQLEMVFFAVLDKKSLC